NYHTLSQKTNTHTHTHTHKKRNPSQSKHVKQILASAATLVLASPLPPTDPNPVQDDALVANPDRYAGDPETSRGFLLQSSLVFKQQPSQFPTERSKVAYMISLLTNRAQAWATSLWELDSPDTALGESFARARSGQGDQ
uniref:DUF4939 domain-containing protein n=1 Tax=Pygocentrus nattereri TaxID=42514 RepID=A0AAR2JKA2_PYGNA